MIRREIIFIAVILLLAFAGITVAKHWGGLHSSFTAASAQKTGTLPTFWTYYNKATQYRLQDRIDSSIANYQEALQLNPNHEDALYYNGNMFMKAGLFDSAQATWERLIRINPQSERAFNQLGNLFFCVDHPDFFHPDTARSYFLRASDLNKESQNPSIRLGEIALFQNRTAEAYDLLSKTTYQKNPEVYFIMGYLHWKLGLTTLAISDLEHTLELKGLKIAYDEAGKVVSTKNGPGGKMQDCSLFLHWVNRDLNLPQKYDLQSQMPKIYRNFDQYLALTRRQLNRQ